MLSQLPPRDPPAPHAYIEDPMGDWECDACGKGPDAPIHDQDDDRP
jgi:hypothetical protein